MDKFTEIIDLFFIYSVIGWLWETIYCSLRERRFVYRGFLVGPYCPIYGFGILTVLYFIEPYQENVGQLFFFAAVVVTILEYLTSYILELLFHTTWWDYHDVPFNINGRIAVPVSIFWGLCCVLIVRVVNPQVLHLETWIFNKIGAVFSILIILVMSSDLIYTIIHMNAFRKITKEAGQILAEKKSELETRRIELTENLSNKSSNLKIDARDKLKEATSKYKETSSEWLEDLQNLRELRNNLPKLGFTEKRYLRNYRRLKFKDLDNTNDLLKYYHNVQKRIKQEKQKVVEKK